MPLIRLRQLNSLNTGFVNNLTEGMFVVEALTKLTTAGVDQLKGNQIYRSSIRVSEMQLWLVYVNRLDGLFGR